MARLMGPLFPQNRRGVWYFVRRVPKAFKHVERRSLVKVTTGVRVADDPRGARAARIVLDLNDQLEREWQDRAAGRAPNAQRAFTQATAIAKHMGLAYAPAAQIATAPVEELVRRIEVLEHSQTGDDAKVVDAVLGGVDAPPLTLSGLLPIFQDIVAASMTDRSAGQLKRWRGNKERAIRNAIAAFGDKAVLDLTRDDAIALRRHFQKRILAGELAINTVNIEISHFTKILKVVELERQLGIPLAAFAGLSVEGGQRKQRPPFATDFIQSKIFAEGALAGLDPEPRRLVFVMIETGMRPSEIIGLLPRHIHIDAPVPFVQIRADGKRLKTAPSERDMPLVGSALAAMRLQRKGFPRYRERADELSGVVNRYLRDAGLAPTSRHTLYGFRHSFEDRLTAVDAPDKVIGRLMGHKGTREKYGNGPSLEHLQSWLERIAFRPPLKV